MGVLFPHNQKAYEAACAMLAETGKACVIHPTGTGKSFIGFQLCADHPEATVLWLSPSEYIFHTQLENWSSAGGMSLPNITFFTYARLMMMDEAEIAAVQADYFILDEFHRCGASMWGQGVQRLLVSHPGIPILGLSATNIRYLDNQRDMADELFENNIASQMTLGDAIVRGILTPPKYVLSVFRYQQSLEKLELRVRGAKSKASRDAAQEYFEKLRRALENSTGLPEIFSKHMPDYHGKYLVFCSNAEHMDEMIEKAGEWFAQVDPNPHIYRAYAEDPATFKAFQSFKSDNSDHLKLLYCIDMLNEGIHISDVNGVILLRPTVSPIIYKQQIGRALSASSKSPPYKPSPLGEGGSPSGLTDEVSEALSESQVFPPAGTSTSPSATLKNNSAAGNAIKSDNAVSRAIFELSNEALPTPYTLTPNPCEPPARSPVIFDIVLNIILQMKLLILRLKI